MPTLVMAGSARTHATSPGSSARSSASTSLNSTARVVRAGSTGGPKLLVLGTVAPFLSDTKVSSTVPW